MVDSASKDVEDAAAAPGGRGVDAEPHTGRTSWPVAACHIVTVFLGPGVLALPYITSRLGWAGSTAGVLCCFCLTLWTSGLLADVYQVDGRRHGRYDIAVRSILGKRHGLFLVTSQHVNLTLANIGFQIAAADACSVIAGTICRSRSNSTPLLAAGPCWNNRMVLTVAVGVAQLLLSQMRNLQAARVTSAVGGAAAVVFCIITLGLAASKAGNRQGTLTGYNAPAAAKVLSAFNALGSICFGLNAPIITLEVADTLRQPPAAAAAAAAMKKSLALGLGTCLLLFALCGGLGYAALGDAVSGSLLLAFQDEAPAWVIVLGSVMVVLSMVPAYQVCCQPTFAAFEDSRLLRRIAGCCSCTSSKTSKHRPISSNNNSSSSNSNDAAYGNSCTSSHASKHRPTSSIDANSSSSTRNAWVVSLLFRCAYVAFTTLIAVALPFFAVILGLVAALTFYQTGVLYPVLLHRKVFPRKPAAVVVMSGVLLLAAAVTAMVVVGSVAVVVMSASRLSPLKVL